MYLTSQQALALTEESLREFLALAIPERLYLDYKQALSGTEKEAKREFLKDVTAFANSAGDHLFLGVKEPVEGVTVEEQIIGLDEGNAVAQSLERLCNTSIDPRIPGLRIIPISLANGKWCIAIHVPPSLSRPHMVNHAGHRTFYVRHSESSDPMSTHEVREAVLTSSSAEARARFFVERRLLDVRVVIGERQPAFFLQAMPLISPESPWDVLSTPFEDVLRGDGRRVKYLYGADLASNVTPRPTIDGLLGQDQREYPTWETEVHRTGYLSVFYRDIKTGMAGGVSRFLLHPGMCDIFRAFCHMLKELLEVSGTDVPYLVTCASLNAGGACLCRETKWEDKFSDPYQKKDILWPEHLRATGMDPMPIAERLCLEMFNAFGLKKIK